MDIVTGHVGSAHVTSWQDRDLNQGIFGPDTYILNVGSKMAASIITNNEIHIADGTLVMQGCQGAIQRGTYDTISIDNGSSGMKRNDLICAEYTKVGGVESLGWTVIKGTPSATYPTDPSYTSGDIQNGDTPVQAPIYRVNINGLTIESVYQFVDVKCISGDDLPCQYTGSTTMTSGGTTITMPLDAGYPAIDISGKGVYICEIYGIVAGLTTGTVIQTDVRVLNGDGTTTGLVGAKTVVPSDGGAHIQGLSIARVWNISNAPSVECYLGVIGNSSSQTFDLTFRCYRIG